MRRRTNRLVRVAVLGTSAAALVSLAVGAFLAGGDPRVRLERAPLDELLAGAARFEGEAVVHLGLYLMLAVPVVRSAAIVLSEARGGNRAAAVLALGILSALLVLYANAR